MGSAFSGGDAAATATDDADGPSASKLRTGPAPPDLVRCAVDVVDAARFAVGLTFHRPADRRNNPHLSIYEWFGAAGTTDGDPAANNDAGLAVALRRVRFAHTSLTDAAAWTTPDHLRRAFRNAAACFNDRCLCARRRYVGPRTMDLDPCDAYKGVGELIAVREHLAPCDLCGDDGGGIAWIWVTWHWTGRPPLKKK
jgi:hypothetical protein